MDADLQAILRQGDADLCRTCGERISYTSRSVGKEISIRAVVGAAPIEYVTDGPGGQQIVCTRAVDVSANQFVDGVVPTVGDRIRTASGERLIVVRVTAVAYDPSVHIACSVIS